MQDDIKDAEGQLSIYEDDFRLSVFVPFPTVDDAVEAITETGINIIPFTSRIAFYRDIIEKLNLEIEKEMTW